MNVLIGSNNANIVIQFRQRLSCWRVYWSVKRCFLLINSRQDRKEGTEKIESRYQTGWLMVDVKDEYWMMIKEQPFITRFTCSIKAFAFSLLGNISIEALTGKGRDGISDCRRICSGRIVIHIRIKWKWQFFHKRQIYGKHRLQSMLKLLARISNISSYYFFYLSSHFASAVKWNQHLLPENVVVITVRSYSILVGWLFLPLFRQVCNRCTS